MDACTVALTASFTLLMMTICVLTMILTWVHVKRQTSGGFHGGSLFVSNKPCHQPWIMTLGPCNPFVLPTLPMTLGLQWSFCDIVLASKSSPWTLAPVVLF